MVADWERSAIQMNPKGSTDVLISIIVAVLNGRETLQQCIDSIAQQTYPMKELIIVDGGSIDGTVDLLRANAGKINVVISEPDRGVYSAWNKGLAAAQGDWICFMGADDFLWDAKALKKMAAHLKGLPQSERVAYGKIVLVNNEGQSLSIVGRPWEQSRASFKRFMSLPHVGMMHRRDLFEEHGNFDESFKIAGDYELLLRELKKGSAIFISDVIVAGQRVGGISTRAENNLRIKKEVWRAQARHGLLWRSGAVGWDILNEYLKLTLHKLLGDPMAEKLIKVYARAKSKVHIHGPRR